MNRISSILHSFIRFNIFFIHFQHTELFSEKQFLVPGTSGDENANESEADKPYHELPLLREPDDLGSLPAIKGHSGVKAASSLPLPTAGYIHGPIAYLRQRSRSETSGVIVPWPSPREVEKGSCSPRDIERDRTESVKSLLEDALIDEGISITVDDPLVRVAEQEIAEAFDVSEDELHEAAGKILADASSRREVGDESRSDKECLDEDRTTAEADSLRTSPNVSLRWSGGIQMVPDSELVITDL